MMHILGALFIILMVSPLLSLGDVVGAWWFDRTHPRNETEPTEENA